MTEFILVIIEFHYSTKTACEQALHLSWGEGGRGVVRSHKSSTRKETRVQGSLRSPYKMERLLRWLCSTQASDHLYSFSPLTYFCMLLYLAHALKAPKSDLYKKGKPSPFSLLGIPLCVGPPQQKQFEVNLSCDRFA